MLINYLLQDYEKCVCQEYKEEFYVDSVKNIFYEVIVKIFVCIDERFLER